MSKTFNITTVFWSLMRIIPRVNSKNLRALIKCSYKFIVDESVMYGAPPTGNMIKFESFLDMIRCLAAMYDPLAPSANQRLVANITTIVEETCLAEHPDACSPDVDSLGNLFSSLDVC